MEMSRRFMPLLTELGDWEMDFAIRVAPTGAPAFQRQLFNSAREFLDTPLLATLKVATATKAGEPLKAISAARRVKATGLFRHKNVTKLALPH